MKKSKIVSSILCVALIMFVASFVWAKPTVYDKNLKWEWRVNGDEDAGGSSTITMKEETIQKLPGYAFKGNITNKYEYGFVNVKAVPDDATLEILKTCSGFSFKFIGDGDRYAVKILTSDVKDSAYFEYAFETVKGQAITVVVPTNYLMQPPWGKTISQTIKTNLAVMIEFQTTRNGSPGPFEFKVYDLKLYTGEAPVLSSADKKANDAAVKAAADAAAKAPKVVGGKLDVTELILADNFQYGGNYQIIYAPKNLFNGNKIMAGDSYTLKITYSTSRDLEDDITVGLVDNSNSGWNPLTYKNDSKDNPFKTGENAAAILPKSKAGEVVSATLKMTAKRNAGGTAANANALVFATAGAGNKGSAGSGKLKAVTLKVTEFVFTKD